MIKRILVGLGTSRTAATVTHYAIDIAKANRASLAGIAITDAARRRSELVAGYFHAHGRQADADALQGDARTELLPYAQTWQADLIVAGNSAKNLLLRRLFGETALTLLRESPLPLYLAQ